MTTKVYEAAIDERGHISLLEHVACCRLTRALVIVLEGEEPTVGRTLSNGGREVSQPTLPSAETSPSWTSRYQQVRDLGQGGMGRVLLAKRLSDDALVCLKFLHRGVNTTSLEQECRALLRLRHPSIVALLDFSASERPPWLVMEYATGSILSEYLRVHGPLDTKTVIEFLKPLMEGLECAHSQKVIHRDLKPSNLVVERGRPGVRILDFGIALVDNFDQDGVETAFGGVPAGTLLYMAPEQLNSELLSPACDVYAAGLIACEMLMGRLPFRSTETPKVIVEKLQPGGCKVDELPATVPPVLIKLIENCTRREPTERPSASEALAVLQDLFR